MQRNMNEKADVVIQLRPFCMIAIIVVVLSAIMSWMGYGQDIEYHAERVAALAEEMHNGFGIYRIYTTVCDGYGYASPMFYGDIFLYPAAALVALGMPLGVAFRIFLASIMVFSFVSMYFCAKSVFGKEYAMFTAYLYAFSPILLTNIFIRYAVGESLAFIFIPIVLLGFYRIVIEPKNERLDWIWLGIGMSGLIFSHIISTVLTVILLVLLCIIFIRKIWERKIAVLYIVFAAMLTVGITAYFTMPMLEQMATSQFFVMNRQESDLAGNVAPIIGLFFGSEYLNVLNVILEKVAGQSHRITFDWFSGGYGYILFFALWIRIRGKGLQKNKFVDLCIILGLFYLVLSVVPFIQPFVEPIVGFMKLPWRNLTFYILFIALATAGILTQLWNLGKKQLVRVGILLATFGTVLAFAGLVMITWHNGMFPYEKLSTASVGLGEYLPSAVPDYDYSLHRGDKVECSDENAEYTLSRENGYTRLTVANLEQDTVFEVPVYMYRGYTAENEQSGMSYTTYVSDNGLVEFELPRGTTGTIKVYYKGTLIQKLSDMISIVTIFGLLMAVLCNREKNKN